MVRLTLLYKDQEDSCIYNLIILSLFFQSPLLSIKVMNISTANVFFFVVIIAEAVALIAAGTVHRVCITTW